MSDPVRILALVGRTLYGDLWRRPIARDLGVDPRLVRRWAARAATMRHPEGVRDILFGLLLDRRDELSDELMEVEAAIGAVEEEMWEAP